jgi:ABC-2 type transport system permease protein
MKWRVVRAIARKDILDGIKNLYVLFSLLLPVGLSLLFRLVFPGMERMDTLAIAVYDPGGSRLVTGLRESPQVQLIEAASTQQVEDEVESKAVGGIVVPEGFDAAVTASEHPTLTVYLNGRRGGGELAAFQRLVEQQVWALVDDEFPANITWTDVGAPPGMRSQGEFNFGRYMLIVTLVMALSMNGALVVPLLVVEEKEKHTLQALLLSPARPAEVAAGKALTGLVYSLLGAALLIVLNRGWVGDWPVTALVALLGSLFTVTAGLLLGSLFRTSMQVNTWATLVAMALMAPSWVGMIPSPAFIQTACRFLPTYYLTHGLTLSFAGEASPARVGLDLAVLAGSTLVAFAAVAWTLRREER